MIVVNIMQNLLSGLATETERRRAMKRIIRLRGWDNEYMPGAHPGLPEGHAHKGKRGKLRPRPGSAPEETEQIVKCIAGSNLPIYWPAFWYRIARHLNAPHNLLTHVRSSETPDVLAMLYTAPPWSTERLPVVGGPNRVPEDLEPKKAPAPFGPRERAFCQMWDEEIEIFKTENLRAEVKQDRDELARFEKIKENVVRLVDPETGEVTEIDVQSHKDFLQRTINLTEEHIAEREAVSAP